MLKVEGVNQYYGGSHILRGLSFEAKLGEVTVVLGRNGVGKTTLIRALVGQQPVRSGSIVYDSRDITAMPAYERARNGIAVMSRLS